MCAHQAKASDRSLIGTVLGNKCPRCREGKLYRYRNPYDLRHYLDMHDHCPVCGQSFSMQVGFYYGTGYVSYGLSVLLTGISFILWWVTIGFSLNDSRLFWWLGCNIILLLGLQPVLTRLSRSVWLAIFVPYDRSRRNSTAPA